MNLTLTARRTVALIMLVSCINFWMGCQRFYLPVQSESTSAGERKQEIKAQTVADKTFILRRDGSNYLMQNVVVEENSMMLKATLAAVPWKNQVHIRGNKKRQYRRSAGEQAVLNEVHIFVNDKVEADSGKTLSLKMGDIEKMEIITKDGPRTTSSYVLGGLALTLGIAATFALIVTLTKESCPYVSVYNNDRFILQGELFGGAIYPSLQRQDFIPLDIKASNGEYAIKISNELKERQYTDYANLLLVEHEPHVKVLADASGIIHTISQPQIPVRATMRGTDINANINYKDNKSYLFDDFEAANNISHADFTFRNTEKKNKAKLLLNLRNSYWFDYLYGQFTKGFGSHYNKWIKQQKARPASELVKWSNEQNIPLTVSVKVADEWREVHKVKTIGPLLNREIVIPVDVPDREEVEIRLSAGFMFWELDYAAIDFSADNTNLTVRELQPFEAVNEKDENVLQGLSHADNKYLSQPNTGDAAVLKYRSVESKEGMSQTVIPHTSGYYEHVRDYKGFPKIAFLNRFKKPGHLAAFSKQKFVEVKNNQAALAKTTPNP